MDSLVIQLLGREYKVSVKPEEKETLQAAVAMVGEHLQRLSDKSPSGSEALATMAALSIAHEFVISQRKAGVDLPAHRSKINALSERIDQALTQQKTLF